MGKETDQAVVVLHLHVDRGDIGEVSQSCKCRNCPLLVRGGIYWNRWGKYLTMSDISFSVLTHSGSFGHQ